MGGQQCDDCSTCIASELWVLFGELDPVLMLGAFQRTRKGLSHRCGRQDEEALVRSSSYIVLSSVFHPRLGRTGSLRTTSSSSSLLASILFAFQCVAQTPGYFNWAQPQLIPFLHLSWATGLWNPWWTARPSTTPKAAYWSWWVPGAAPLDLLMLTDLKEARFEAAQGRWNHGYP